MSATRARIADRRLGARVFAPIVAIVYLGLGLGALVQGPGTGRAAGVHVLFFSSNTLLAILHVLIGVAAVAAWVRPRALPVVAVASAAVCAGLTAYGVTAVIAGADQGDPFNVSWADNWLHVVTVVAGALAWNLDRTTARSTSVEHS